MGSHNVMYECKSCGKSTQHLQKSTSHILHLLLSVVTAGFWIPVWILVTMSNSGERQCTECGKKRGLFGT